MINIIIYEDSRNMQDLYKKALNRYFKSKKQDIKLYIFDHYNKNLETKFRNISGKKIYIMDIEVPGKSGLDLARNIRESGDWMSPLIVITSYSYLRNTGFTSKVLMLDFICKREPVEKRLIETLDIIYGIVNDFNNYTFQYNGEVFHVHYDDVCYFEKDLNDNYTFLYTKYNSYKINESIIQIGKKLEDDPHFFKIHRSCIINLDNINYLDWNNSVIRVGQYDVKLLTEHRKNKLKRLITDDMIINN